MHHDEAVAVGDGVLHVVGDHHGHQVVLLDDLPGELEHLCGGAGIQRGGVLVQQQELGLLERGHQQGQRLTLSAGEQAHLGGHAILQPQAQGLELLAVTLALGLGNANPQGALLAAARSQRKVLLDLHGGGGAGHGILEHAAQQVRAAVLGQVGHVRAVDDDPALVHRPHAGDGVQDGGLARAVAADDGHEVAVLQVEVHAVERDLLIDGLGVESLADVDQVKHACGLPSCGSCPSSRGSPGTERRSARRGA